MPAVGTAVAVVVVEGVGVDSDEVVGGEGSSSLDSEEAASTATA